MVVPFIRQAPANRKRRSLLSTVVRSSSSEEGMVRRSEPGSSKAESMAGPLIFESICVSAGNALNVTCALPHSNRSTTPVLFVAAGIREHLL